MLNFNEASAKRSDACGHRRSTRRCNGGSAAGERAARAFDGQAIARAGSQAAPPGANRRDDPAQFSRGVCRETSSGRPAYLARTRWICA